jgi:transposase
MFPWFATQSVGGPRETSIVSFRAALPCLVTIPGISATTAHVNIAEIGVDMSRFATVAHFRSWAGLFPQLNECAGKNMSRRLRHGARWLKTVLVKMRLGGDP